MRPTSRIPRGRRWAAASLVLTPLLFLPTQSQAVCTNPVLFAAGVQIETGPKTLFFASGDFNEDGRLDLAVTNSNWQAGGVNASVAVLLGSDDGLMLSVAYPVGLQPHGVVAADFNKDGILDLAVANKLSSSISILLGLGSEGVGNGFFAGAVNYPAGGQPFKLVTADFNEDGILDLAAAINDAAKVNILPGLGSSGTGNG
jgi:hypothetical protein